MDKGEIIRFKVEIEKFTDQTPVNPTAAAAKVEGESDEAVAAAAAAAEMHSDPPYQLNVSD